VAADFFTAEVLTVRGLITYYVLFCIDLGTRIVHIAGITAHPNQQWMVQVSRNLTMVGEATNAASRAVGSVMGVMPNRVADGTAQFGRTEITVK